MQSLTQLSSTKQRELHQRSDAEPSLPFAITADELLEVCGPSWAAMTPAQRETYGPAHQRPPESPSLVAIGDLLDLALRFPRCVAAEGLEVVAERWYAPDDVVALAQLLDSEESNGIPLRRSPREVRAVADVADRKEGMGPPAPLSAMRASAPRSLRLVR